MSTRTAELRRALPMLLATAVLWTGACAEKHQAVPAEAEAPLAQLPAPLALAPRSASAALNVVEGSEYSVAEGSQLVTPAGTDLQFTPAFPPGSTNPLGLSYALFGFHHVQYFVNPELHLEWITAPDGPDLWVGYSDFSSNTWIWTQAEASVSDIAVSDLQSWMSPGPDSIFYVALVLTGQGQAVLDYLRIGSAFPEDAIFAIPSRTSVSAGQTVRVTVFTNKAANPMLYMLGARIVVPESCTIVPESFNAGAEGGAAGDPDGIWADAGNSDFLLLPSNFYEEPHPVDAGLVGYDFNVTPIGGTDISQASGAIFNFSLLVNEDTQLGFMALSTFPYHTYYGDSTPFSEYLWADSSNAGMPAIDVL